MRDVIASAIGLGDFSRCRGWKHEGEGGEFEPRDDRDCECDAPGRQPCMRAGAGRWAGCEGADHGECGKDRQQIEAALSGGETEEDQGHDRPYEEEARGGERLASCRASSVAVLLQAARAVPENG